LEFQWKVLEFPLENVGKFWNSTGKLLEIPMENNIIPLEFQWKQDENSKLELEKAKEKGKFQFPIGISFSNADALENLPRYFILMGEG